VLNTIVADALREMADELEKAKDFDKAVIKLIKKTVTEHKRIVFNGNGYSDEWLAEAEKRGLPNVKSMVEAIPYLVREDSIEMFERQGVYTRTELESRAEINYEIYSKAINIEAKTMIEMASKLYIPAVIKYTKSLADSILAVKGAVSGADVSVQEELLTKTSALLAQSQKALSDLKEKVVTAAEKEEGAVRANYFHEEVFTAMARLREPIDALEMIVDKSVWPVPTYGDLLFEV
ncbi:MAG: glutamine synthetase type III, partial [Lachnospiraceae bacterium]|nr:glutamine synthetase type III [Lachnospiraceae bacterium]